MHTPGPWKKTYFGVAHDLEDGRDGVPIADCILASNQNIPYEEKAANATLMAAAPDMFAALESFEAEFYERFNDMAADIQEGGKLNKEAHAKLSNALAALKKARGE